MLLKEFNDDSRDRRRIDVAERVNECLDRRTFWRKIKRTVRAAWRTLRRAPVERTDLLDRSLLICESRDPVAFSTVMQHRPGLRWLD